MIHSNIISEMEGHEALGLQRDKETGLTVTY